MKLKKLLPIISVGSLTLGMIPMVSCSPTNPDVPDPKGYYWDFVANKGYVSQVKQKVPTERIGKYSAIKTYLKDVKENPMILIDDILLGEVITYYEYAITFGENLTDYNINIDVYDVDPENNLVSIHYISNINATDTSEKHEIKLDFDFKNIRYVSSYQGIQTVGLLVPMWFFYPAYLDYADDLVELRQFLKNMGHNWSIIGSIHDEATPANKLDPVNVDINVNLNEDTCETASETEIGSLELSPMSLYSNYFDNVLVKPDYELVYDSSTQKMRLETPITIDENFDYTPIIHMDMSKWPDTTPIERGINIDCIDNNDITTPFYFSCRIDSSVYSYEWFKTTDYGHYWNNSINLNRNSDAMLFVHANKIDLEDAETINFLIYPGTNEV